MRRLTAWLTGTSPAAEEAMAIVGRRAATMLWLRLDFERRFDAALLRRMLYGDEG